MSGETTIAAKRGFYPLVVRESRLMLELSGLAELMNLIKTSRTSLVLKTPRPCRISLISSIIPADIFNTYPFPLARQCRRNKGSFNELGVASIIRFYLLIVFAYINVLSIFIMEQARYFYMFTLP